MSGFSLGPALRVLDEVGGERLRQERLVAEGKFSKTCADPTMHDADRLAVLVEEVGEVATGLLHARGEGETGDGDLRTELIQVAAVAVAWVESIDAVDASIAEEVLIRRERGDLVVRPFVLPPTTGDT